ncbi:MAG: hypothetical protein HOB20_02800 [Planctomycetaceae bacterium]|nr:hypothetical protein [Planctomycetaceae bacterium]
MADLLGQRSPWTNSPFVPSQIVDSPVHEHTYDRADDHHYQAGAPTEHATIEYFRGGDRD